MPDLKLQVSARTTSGKNENRRLRAQGLVPAIVYGGGLDPISVQLPARDVEQLLRKHGENSVFELQLAGTDQARHTMIRDLQIEATTSKLLHIDFQRILLDQKVRVRVPVEVVGVPEGVKTDGGLLEFVSRELEVECLPHAIPSLLSVEVSELLCGQHLEAGQVPLPEGVELVEEANRVVVLVATPRGAEEEEADAEEESDLLTTAEAEPDVVGRTEE